MFFFNIIRIYVLNKYFYVQRIIFFSFLVAQGSFSLHGKMNRNEEKQIFQASLCKKPITFQRKVLEGASKLDFV